MVLTLALFTSLLFSTAALARASPEGPPAWHQAQPHAPKPRAIERSKSSETTTTRWTGAYLDVRAHFVDGLWVVTFWVAERTGWISFLGRIQFYHWHSDCAEGPVSSRWSWHIQRHYLVGHCWRGQEVRTCCRAGWSLL